MHPILFEIFGYPFRFYGLAMATAFIVNIALVYRRSPIEGQDRQVVLNTCLWIIIGTLVGGRVLFAFTQWGEFSSEPWRIFSFWEGGLVFYGGFIGSYIAALGYTLWVNMNKGEKKLFKWGLLAGTLVAGYALSGISILRGNGIKVSFFGKELITDITISGKEIYSGGGLKILHYLQDPELAKGIFHWLFFPNYGLFHCIGFIVAFTALFTYISVKSYKRAKENRILPILDILSPYMGLGLAIHRSFGCFMNGCCYGRETLLPWGVQFPLEHPGTKWYGFAAHLHPTQLYEALNGMSIFFILLWFRNKKRSEGEVTGWLLMIYAINRYFIEFFRGDSKRGDLGEPTSALVFLLGFAAVVSILLAILYLVRKRGISKEILPPDDSKMVFGRFFILMGFLLVLTFVCELFRREHTLVMVGPISTSQFIGYFTFSAGFVIYVVTHYLGRKAKPLLK